MGAAQKPPGDGLFGKRGLEPAVHVMADMFTVAQAILHERNLISGQKIKISANLARQFGDSRAFVPDISAVPQRCRERIRIADEQTIGIARGGVFAAALFSGLRTSN